MLTERSSINLKISLKDNGKWPQVRENQSFVQLVAIQNFSRRRVADFCTYPVELALASDFQLLRPAIDGGLSDFLMRPLQPASDGGVNDPQEGKR